MKAKFVKESLFEEGKPWYVQKGELEDKENEKGEKDINLVKDELIKVFTNKEPVKVSGGLYRGDIDKDHLADLNPKIISYYTGGNTKTYSLYFNYRGHKMFFEIRPYRDDVLFASSLAVFTMGSRKDIPAAVRKAIEWVDKVPQNRL